MESNALVIWHEVQYKSTGFKEPSNRGWVTAQDIVYCCH